MNTELDDGVWKTCQDDEYLIFARITEDTTMTFFEGDLLTSDLSLRNVQGMIATDNDRDTPSWTGHFEVTAENATYLNNDKSYLLLLDSGLSARVMLTGWQSVPDTDNLQVCFEPVAG